MKNTTSSQDDDIRLAERQNHIEALIDIIKDLDGQITEWKAAAQYAAGVSNPEDLRELGDCTFKKH